MTNNQIETKSENSKQARNWCSINVKPNRLEEMSKDTIDIQFYDTSLRCTTVSEHKNYSRMHKEIGPRSLANYVLSTLL